MLASSIVKTRIGFAEGESRTILGKGASLGKLPKYQVLLRRT